MSLLQLTLDEQVRCVAPPTSHPPPGGVLGSWQYWDETWNFWKPALGRFPPSMLRVGMIENNFLKIPFLPYMTSEPKHVLAGAGLKSHFEAIPNSLS